MVDVPSKGGEIGERERREGARKERERERRGERRRRERAWKQGE